MLTCSEKPVVTSQLRHACVWLVLAATGLAQDARVIGKVVDRAGRPVEGARVVLRSHGWVFHPDLGQVHQVEATTRKNGRFRASLFAQRRYSAWAAIPGSAGRFSKVAEDVLAGRPLTLRAEEFERRSPRVRIEGLGAWKNHAPFRFRCVSDARHFVMQPVSRAEDDLVTLPSWPGSRVSLEILDSEGQPLAQRWFSTDKAGKSDETEVWKIKEPFIVRMHIEAFEKAGVAIEGARVETVVASTHHDVIPIGSRIHRELSRVLGVSDAHGKVRIELPTSRYPMSQHFSVEARGRVLTAVRLRSRGKSFSTVEEAADGSFDVAVRLKRGAAVEGRVVDRAGEGIGGLRLTYPRLAALWFENQGASWRTLTARLIETDPDGSFRFEPLMPDRRAVITALPSPAQLSRMVPGVDDEILVPQSVALFVHVSKNDEATQKLGDLRATLRRQEVHVTRDGRPVSFARIFVIAQSRGHGDRVSKQIDCDRRGQATLYLAPTADDLLVWERESGYVIHDLAESTSTDSSAEPLRLELGPFRWISGRVLDKAGDPIEGATLESYGESTRGTTRHVCIQLNHLLRKRRTDAEGRFRIPFVPEPNWSVRLRASVEIAGKRYHSTSQRQCPALDEDLHDVDFEIDVK